MKAVKVFVPLFMAVFWTYACVCIKFAPTEPPVDRNWERFNPPAEVDPDGCCLKNEPEFDFGPLEPTDEINLKKGSYIVTFNDIVNPIIGWEIDHYELYNQWGEVVAEIPPNDHGSYVVRGVPKGCYRLRAIGKEWDRNVPSAPSNEGCTPGLKTGRIWS